MPEFRLTDLTAWVNDKLPEWQRDVFRRVVEGGEIDEDNLLEVVSIALAAHGVESDAPAPLELAADPELSESRPPAIRISRIDDIQRVNALASGPLKLDPEGLNVIYGGNASGKSGLTRILKKVCQARDPGGPILPNVYEDSPREPASATIGFVVDDNSCEITWTDGTASDSRLGHVNVFDSRCAAVQVEQANRITYTPKILQLFGDLASAVDGVASKIRAQIEELGEGPPELVALELNAGTAAEQFISSLSKESNVETLESLCAITEQDRARMSELERALGADPVRGAEAKDVQVRHARDIKSSVEAVVNHLSDEAFVQYETLVTENKRAKAAANAARVAFEGNSDLDGFGTDEWRSLWEAARLYSEQHAYVGTPFPVVGDDAKCVVCQQKLTPDAITRVQSFEAFVQAEAQKLAAEAANAVANKAQVLIELDLPRDVRAKIQETGESGTEIGEYLRRFLVIAKLRLRLILRLFNTDDMGERPTLPDAPAVAGLINKLELEAAELRRASEDRGRNELLDEQAGLCDRVKISGLLEIIKNEIARLNTLSKLQSALADCKTQPITLKRRVAAKSVLTGRLQGAFAHNLLSLGFGSSPVEYRLGAGEHGDHPVEMKLTPRPEIGLEEVLSEGERTCVALAGLLAELETTGNRSALVLDDPVTSLDHQYRKRVAERLLREAGGRQVVVLTHDIVFLFLLRKYQSELGVRMTEASVHRGYRGNHGQVEEGPPWDAMPVKSRIKRLRGQLNIARAVLKDEGRLPYERHAGEIYKRLRMCWERAVEEVLLNQAVVRFGDSVQTRRLTKLTDICTEDIEIVTREMSRCSDFEHDESGAVRTELPEPDVIEGDIATLADWVKVLRTTRDRN